MQIRGEHPAALGRHLRAGNGTQILAWNGFWKLCRPRRDVSRSQRCPLVVKGWNPARRKSEAYRVSSRTDAAVSTHRNRPLPNQKYPAAGREGEFYLFF